MAHSHANPMEPELSTITGIRDLKTRKGERMAVRITNVTSLEEGGASDGE